ncbi:phage tail tape measure protein [Verminephrobacter aporrectodeae subsp. tuberculatae]|uniref:phage tail tape measure protein n=1 Tax=Verminephrobacter aporrectodeae TaxID=1110389 RepID=UPI002242F1E6|nr:phage tail tape measure protein [Verminephrobacter aporrectodeae]MCW8207644.1 phage tail tape measure protein [Verminephrobacter aporrectodeae subsp. tuberculatae]
MAENLRLRVILDLAERAVAPLKRISQGSKETAQALSGARKALRDLNAQQGAIERMRGLQQQLASTGQQIKSATVLLEQMRRATPATAAEQKNWARTIAIAERALERLNGTADGQRQRLITLRRVMKEMGIANVTEAEARLRTQIDATTRSIQRQQAQLSRLATLREAAASAAVKAGAAVGVGLGLQAVGHRGVDFGMLPVKSFADHEDAMLGIARQVPGARDAGGQLTDVYRNAEVDVRDLSTKIPLATTEIAAMMTAAARMEVPVGKLKEFTLMASQMATAFDATPDAMTEAMGKVAKNFKIPLTEIGGLADSINYLDDNAISKGSDIIDFLNRTSGVISNVAMSAKDSAALGSTLLTLGERAETASTATNTIIQKFAAATKGTKKFRSALKEIGLNDTDVQKGIATDAMGTLFKVIDAIKRLPKDKRVGVMVELVGMEHSDTLAKLIDKPEELIRQRDLSNDKAAQGSMAREAAARNATLSAQWLMAENRIFNLKSAIGETLKPALIELMQGINPVLQATARWVKENSGLVSAVLKVVLVSSALMVLLGSVLVPLALFAGKLILLRYLLATLGAKLFGVGAGMRILYSLGYAAGRVFAFLVPVLSAVAAAMLRLGAVLLAHPVIAIIALIAAAAFLIWQNWATIKAYLIAAWDALAAAATRWWSSLTSGGQATWQYLVALKNQFFQTGADLMDGIANGITSRLLAVRDAITAAADATVGWFKEKLGIQSPSRVFMEVGGYISEGAALGILRNQHLVRAASLAMAGAAMATSPGQATALPPITQARAGAGTPGMGVGQAAGSSYQITVHAAPGMDPQAIARAVRTELDKRERMARSRVLSQMSDTE